MIGEYIHYRYRNYLKNGLAREKGSSSGGVQEAYQAAKEACFQQMQESMSSEEKVFLDKMTTAANFFLEYNRGVVKNPSPPPGFPKDGVEKIREYIDKSIQEATRDAVLTDYGTGTVQSGSFKGKSEVKKKSALSTKGVSQNIGAIKSRYSNIINFMKQPIDFRDPSIKNKVDTIKRYYAELEPFFQQFLQDRNESATYSYKTLLSVIAELESVNGVTSKNLKQKMLRLVKKINEFNGCMKAFGIDTTLQGNFLEDLVYSGALYGAEATIDKEKSKVLRHFKDSMNAIGVNVLGGERVLASNPSYSYSNSLGQWVCKVTDQKTDVEFWLNNNSNNRSLNISAKNVNLSGFGYNQIHLLSGTSVLQLLQEHENFINHYLNIVPARDDFVYKGQTEDVGASRQDIHNAMRSLILLGAFMGGYRKNNRNTVQGKANIFVVLDNSKGEIKYYDINNFIKKINNNIFRVGSTVPDLKTGDFDDINAIKNQWRGLTKWNNPKNKRSVLSKELANSRIIAMLQQLHKMHLDVSISTQDLQNLSS